MEKFYINGLEVKLNSVYPMTGIARLIFISNKNIDVYGYRIKEFSHSIKVLLIIFYFAFVLIFLWFTFYCYLNIKKKIN